MQKPALSAYISFGDRHAADVHVDAGPGFEDSDEFLLLFHFYAKTMYNLGDNHNAPRLRECMVDAAAAARSGAFADPLVIPDVTRGQFSLQPVGDTGIAAVGAFLETGRSGKYVTTEYQVPPGQEYSFACLAVLAYLQSLLNAAQAWGNLLLVAAGLESMNETYAAGLRSWDSIPGILDVSESGFAAGLKALGEEMHRRGLI
jgi:hypothetical protein